MCWHQNSSRCSISAFLKHECEISILMIHQIFEIIDNITIRTVKWPYNKISCISECLWLNILKFVFIVAGSSLLTGSCTRVEATCLHFIPGFSYQRFEHRKPIDRLYCQMLPPSTPHWICHWQVTESTAVKSCRCGKLLWKREFVSLNVAILFSYEILNSFCFASKNLNSEKKCVNSPIL